jgi:hypothetical protein
MLEGKSAKEWIDLYVDTKPAELRDVAERLRKLMKKTVKSAKESVNSWKIPTYESNGPMCFFMVGKYHVTFGFLRGTSLPDPAGPLEGAGKNVRHVTLRTAEDLKEPALRKLIEAAARLNQKEPTEKVKRARSRSRLKWAGIRDQRSGIRKPDPTEFLPAGSVCEGER